jgi:hypothetical protein
MASSRQISIRLSLEEAEKVREGLRAIGAEGKAALGALESASTRAVQGTNAVATSAGLARHQIQNLTAQAVDFGVQISSGQGLFLPLIQQGPQAIDAVGGVGNALKLAGSFVTPLNVGIAATAAVLIASVAAAERADRAINDLSARLRTTRSDFADLAKQVDATARTLAGTTSLSTADARAAGGAIAGARGFSGTQADLQRLVVVSQDVAKAFGTTVPEAAARMAAALNKPGEAARQLASQDFAAMDDALRRQVQLLEASGQKMEASRLVIDALARGTAGAANELTPFQRAMEEAAQAATRLWNEARPALEGLGRPIMEGIAAGIGLLATAFTATRDAILAVGQAWQTVKGIIPTNADGSIGTLSPGATPDTGAAASGPLTRGALARDATSSQIMDAVRAEAQRQGVDPDFAARVVRRESGGRQFGADGSVIASRAGALGAMQLMPGTAAGLGVDPKDTADNIRGGIMYLAQQMQKYGGDQGLAGAAYNAGPGRVDAYLAGRSTLPAETIAYMNSVGGFSAGGSGTRFSGPSIAVGRAEEQLRGQDGQSQRLAELNGRAGVLERALEAPRLDPADANRYREALEKLRAEIVGLQDPMDEMRRRGQMQAALYSQQEGAARTLAAAEQQGAEQARAAGKSAADQIVAGLVARGQAQANLRRELDDSIARTRLQSDANRSAAAAASDGARAVQEMTLRRQAEIEALKTERAGTDEYRAAVEKLIAAKRDQRAADADLGTANLITQQRDQIALLERETQLIGVSTEARQAELAVLRERQRVINAGGNPDSDASVTAQRNIRQISAQQTANTQLTNSWNELARVGEQAFDRIGSAITEAFVNGKGQAVNFGNIAKAVISEVIQAALRMAVINPVMNAAFGGTRGTLGGIMTVAGGSSGGSLVPVRDASGTVTSYMQQAGDMATMQQAGSMFRGGGTPLDPGYNFSGGSLGRFDSFAGTNIGGFLNTPLYNTVDATTALGNASLSSNLSASGFQYVGDAAMGPVGTSSVAGASQASGAVSIGGAAAGVAGVAGGLYGLYSGYQTGGAKGAAQMVGGAAGVVAGGTALAGGSAAVGAAAAGALGAGAGAAFAAIAAAAPYVAIIAAVVAMLLPAQKPSNREGNYTIDTVTGEGVAGGQEGKKFSQENRDQAKALAEQIALLAKNLGKSTGLPNGVSDSIRIGFGDRDGAFYQNGTERQSFTADENGARGLVEQATRDLLAEALKQTPDANVRSILERTGTTDIEGAMKNLDWYNTTYKALTEAVEKTTQWAQSLKALNAPWDEAIEKARSLGLATEVLTAKQTDAVEKATKSRDLQLQGIGLGLEMELTQSQGGSGLDQIAELQRMQYGVQTITRRDALEEQLEQMGASESEVFARLRTLDDINRTGSENLEKNIAAARRAPNDNFWAADRQVQGRGYLNDLMGLRASTDAAYTERSRAGVSDGDMERLFAGQVKGVLSGLSADQLRDVVTSLGSVDNAAAQLAQSMLDTAEATQAAADAAKKAADREDAAGAASGVVVSLADYVRSLRMGEGSGLSQRAQFDAAAGNFSSTLAGAQAGDWNSITDLQASAEAYRNASRSVNGSGAADAATVQNIANAISSVAGMGADRLTSTVQGAQIETQTQRLERALSAVQAELAALRRETRQQGAAPREALAA